MYICIEGIKGCGKSTVLSLLVKYFRANNLDVVLAEPTKAILNFSFLEFFYKNIHFLQKFDSWNFLIYSHRSNYTGKNINWNAPLILGDRSIITSYATRWNKWLSPHICIEKVNKYMYALPAPNHIIFLDISVDTSLSRIATRQKRSYGKHDETPMRLKECLDAYKEISITSINRLQNSVWHFVNAEQTPNEVFDDVLSIIKNILKI